MKAPPGLSATERRLTETRLASDEETSKVGSFLFGDGQSDKNNETDNDQDDTRSQMEASLSVSIRGPGGNGEQKGTEEEGSHGEQVGLDDRVLVSTDDLSHEITGDGGSGTIADSHGAKDVELPVSEGSEKSLVFELGIGTTGPVGEDSVQGDFLLSLAEELGGGVRPREKAGHGNSEANSQGTLSVERDNGSSREWLTSRRNRICHPCKWLSAWKTPYEIRPEKAPDRH